MTLSINFGTYIDLSPFTSCLQGHQYETVSGFICEAFGYIPRTGESIKVVLEKEIEEEIDESKSDNQDKKDKKDKKEKHQIFKIEV